MKLILNEEQKQVYLMLNQFEENDIYTFCKESIRVLKSGSSKEITETLMRKCGLNNEQVDSIIEHLMLIFSFLIRFKMNETDLEKLIDKQLNNQTLDKVKKSMCKFYELYHNEIQSIITEQTYLNTSIIPRYQDLNWRLQIELSNRSNRSINLLNKTNDINVILRFKLRKLNTDEFDFITMKCNLNQLATIQKTLDQSIKDVKLKKAWINAAFD